MHHRSHDKPRGGGLHIGRSASRGSASRGSASRGSASRGSASRGPTSEVGSASGGGVRQGEFAYDNILATRAFCTNHKQY